jgi:hypothetical protein
MFNTDDWQTNPYYNPEKVGLEIVKVFHGGEAYSFNLIVVWKASDGKFWYGSDSGCSCPSPFEYIRTYDDLNRLHKKNFNKFQDYVTKWAIDGYNSADYTDVHEGLQEVRAALYGQV